MQLDRDAIHIWHTDQSLFDLQTLKSRCLHWLPEQDLHRYHRLRMDRHRCQMLLGQFLMRSVLSCYAGAVKPEEWCFVTNAHGKPALDQERHSISLFFNLSHSQGKLVVAVSSSESIGVDIEASTRSRRIARIAERYFAPQEIAAMLALPLPQQLERFYRLWTLKEAYIKARGLGLAIPLRHFGFLFRSDGRIEVEFDQQLADDASQWCFWQIDAGNSHALALALKQEFNQSGVHVLTGSFDESGCTNKLQMADAQVICKS